MVTLTIVDGPTFNVAWQRGMNAQQAMEAAYNSAGHGPFAFSLQYFGNALGYLVFMINGTSESTNTNETPFFYWEFFYNGAVASKGIDGIILNDGDTLAFKFTEYDPTHPAESTTHVKFKLRY